MDIVFFGKQTMIMQTKSTNVERQAKPDISADKVLLHVQYHQNFSETLKVLTAYRSGKSCLKKTH